MSSRFDTKFNILRLSQGAFSLTTIFLLIEFFDEFNFTIEGAALPAIRTDFGLTYAQIGLLLGIPHLTASLIEPFLMLLGDTRLRKSLIIAGGLTIMLALLLIAFGHSFSALILAMVIAYPASGAFVSLSQATLMDLNPGRQAQLMARWTAAGSLGNLIGPLALAGGLSLGWGWRWAFLALAGLAFVLVLSVIPRQLPATAVDHTAASLSETIKNLGAGLWSAMRNRQLLRWLALLELSDLMLDRFISYVPLYFTDVLGTNPAQASLVLTGIMVASLAADLIAIPLLEKFPGLRLVRTSAVINGIVFTAALLAPWLWVKVILLILVSITTLGWYSVLQGEAYATIPERSGTVMAVNSLTGLVSGGIAWFIGWLAEQLGLGNAMWLLLLGPISLALLIRPTRENLPARFPNHLKEQASTEQRLD